MENLLNKSTSINGCRWGVCRTKPCAFRPTSNANIVIENYKKKHGIQGRGADSRAINEIIEEYKKLSEGPAPPSKFPTRAFCPRDRRWYLLETLMQTCDECTVKKDCIAWHAYGPPPTIK